MPVSARTQNKEWLIRDADPQQCRKLASDLRVSPVVAQVLINRGIEDSRTGSAFLRPKLTQLIPPEQMPGVTDALGIIQTAIEQKKKITIYGDYDVDGITSVTILSRILEFLGAEVDFYIPHRVEEGYGLNPQAIRSLADSGTELLITVDCGIAAGESAQLVRQLGLGLIITDHHEPDEQLPEADAIVHPRLDESYANPDSCGAMVALKLAWALANRFSSGSKLRPALREFMLNATSLAAMGTVADVVSLTGENRVLTRYGLKGLTECTLIGIHALIDSAGLTGQGIDSFHIGFRLAPMLNAAGRMGHARLAVELLNCQNKLRAVRIAEYLKEQNNQRRKCERQIVKEAARMVVDRRLNHPDRRSIILAGEKWHSGVIGIVASRLVDKYYRPAIMISTDNEPAHGSARSIPGFDIREAIAACSEELVSFGGHKMAAGITLKKDNVADFADRFEEYARNHLPEENPTARLCIDSLTSLGEFGRGTVNQLEMLEPFGQDNPEPVFATKGVRLCARPRKVGSSGSHLQLAVTDNTNSIRCIGFGMGKLEKKLLEKDFFNIAYRPQMNHYNGSSHVQLVITDINFE